MNNKNTKEPKLFRGNLLGLFFAIIGMAFSACAAQIRKEPHKIVMITQIVEHPALTSVRKGAIDALRHKNYDPARNVELYYENAQGSITTATQIAQQFAGRHPSVVIAISTPSAQAMVSAARGSFPVVFAAVTDPVSARLVKSFERPGVPVSGVADIPPFKSQFDLIRQVMGEKKRIGVLYSEGEINSVVSLPGIREAAKENGFVDIIEQNVPRSADAPSAARALLGKVDVIYIPNDNTVVSGLEGILSVFLGAKIPVFAADPMLVERGVIASVGVDYHKIGERVGLMAARILDGDDISVMPVELLSESENVLYLNKTIAQKLGLEFPEAISRKAARVF